MLLSAAAVAAIFTAAAILSITAVIISAIWALGREVNKLWPIAVSTVLLISATGLWTFLYLTVGVGVGAWFPIFAFGLLAVGHIYLLIRR